MNTYVRIYIGLVHVACLALEVLALMIASHAGEGSSSYFEWVPHTAALAICIGSLWTLLVAISGPGRNARYRGMYLGMCLGYLTVLAGIALHAFDTMDWIGLAFAAVYSVAVWPVTMIASKRSAG